MNLSKYFHIDWVLFFSTLPLLASGLIAMRSFGAQSDYYFFRQLIWIAVGISIFFLVGITAVMIYFIIRYNKKRNKTATQIEGNTLLEIIWTVIPILLSLASHTALHSCR